MGTFSKTFCGKSPFKTGSGLNWIQRARYADKVEWTQAKANRKKRRYQRKHSN